MAPRHDALAGSSARRLPVDRSNDPRVASLRYRRGASSPPPAPADPASLPDRPAPPPPEEEPFRLPGSMRRFANKTLEEIDDPHYLAYLRDRVDTKFRDCKGLGPALERVLANQAAQTAVVLRGQESIKRQQASHAASVLEGQDAMARRQADHAAALLRNQESMKRQQASQTATMLQGIALGREDVGRLEAMLNTHQDQNYRRYLDMNRDLSSVQSFLAEEGAGTQGAVAEAVRALLPEFKSMMQDALREHGQDALRERGQEILGVVTRLDTMQRAITDGLEAQTGTLSTDLDRLQTGLGPSPPPTLSEIQDTLDAARSAIAAEVAAGRSTLSSRLDRLQAGVGPSPPPTLSEIQDTVHQSEPTSEAREMASLVRETRDLVHAQTDAQQEKAALEARIERMREQDVQRERLRSSIAPVQRTLQRLAAEADQALRQHQDACPDGTQMALRQLQAHIEQAKLLCDAYTAALRTADAYTSYDASLRKCEIQLNSAKALLATGGLPASVVPVARLRVIVRGLLEDVGRQRGSVAEVMDAGCKPGEGSDESVV